MDSLPQNRMRFEDKFYAKKAFSRYFLGYTVLYISAMLILRGVVFILELLLPHLPRNTALAIVSVFNSTAFGIFFPYAILYLIGLPIMYLLIKNTRTWKIEKQPLGIGMFFVLFFVNVPFMLTGTLLGSGANKIINSLLGLEYTGLFSDVPLWAIAILSLVVAPIFEELIFRKLLIDRIGVYGAWLSVIVSGLAFGAFHGTLEQIFYTTFGGIIFAFAYAKTGRIRYSVLLHVMFNFFWTMVPLLVSEYMLNSTVTYQLIGSAILLGTKIGFAIIGFVLFIIGLSCGWFKLRDPEGTVKITSSRARIMFFNLGSILFTLLSIYSLLTGIMPLADGLVFLGLR